MNPINFEGLADAITLASSRSQQFMRSHPDAVSKLLDDVEQIIRNIRTKQGPVFSTTRDKKPRQVLVVKTRWFGSDPLNTRVLTMTEGGVQYAEEDNRLYGAVNIWTSDGDWIDLMKKARGSSMERLLVGQARAGYRQESRDKFEDINREVVASIFRFADEPNAWRTMSDESSLITVDVAQYVFEVLSSVFNPEGN